MRSIAVALLSLAILASCAAPPRSRQPHFERPWLNDPRMKQWEELDEYKAAVKHQGDRPYMQEYEGCGTVFVWTHALSGGPGWEFLKVSYSYKNTTDSDFDIVRVFGEVIDPDGQVVGRQEDVLLHPLGYALSPGDVWSDTLEIPTKGAYKQAGWSFRVGCEPVRMTVLAPARRAGDN